MLNRLRPALRTGRAHSNSVFPAVNAGNARKSNRLAKYLRATREFFAFEMHRTTTR